MSKVDSYIGFAIKSGNIVYGLDNIEKIKRKIPLIILCDSVAKNTRKSIQKIILEKNSQCIVSLDLLEDIAHKTNCKVIAIQDNNLAKAILDNMNDRFVLFAKEVY